MRTYLSFITATAPTEAKTPHAPLRGGCGLEEKSRLCGWKGLATKEIGAITIERDVEVYRRGGRADLRLVTNLDAC